MTMAQASSREAMSHASRPVPAGVRWARWGGAALAGLLLGMAWGPLLTGGDFFPVRAVYFSVYAGLLVLPYRSLSRRAFPPLFGALALSSLAFVFVMIFDVMRAYMAAAEAGERLGVPGFQGTLVFLALLQVPCALFARHPAMLR